MNQLIKFNCPREVLSKQTDYLKNHLYKPMNLTTRQYVGQYNNLNSICEQLQPNFSASQKVSKCECIIIIAGKAPKLHQNILIQQGFNPENGSMADLIDYCEHAEINENVKLGAKGSQRSANASESSSNEK
jgi:hypothetical protein